MIRALAAAAAIAVLGASAVTTAFASAAAESPVTAFAAEQRVVRGGGTVTFKIGITSNDAAMNTCGGARLGKVKRETSPHISWARLHEASIGPLS